MTKDIAASIVKTLFDAGYIAYFAGGWVRDYLLGQISDEIDIATNAPPEHITKLFPKTIQVGAKFGVIIVVIKEKNFEVTTFRKDLAYYDGRHPTGVDFSSPEKDAERRDFTINGMFYDPLTHKIYDFVDGQRDLNQKIIRAIGNPEKRFAEDKLRLIRAIRFAYRLGFTIEEETKKAIIKFSSTLFPSVSIERIWQELKKMHSSPRFGEALCAMHEYGLLQTIFPKLSHVSREELYQRVRYFPYFPLNTPTIVFILELFPDSTLDEWIDLCHYLKISKEDIKLARFFFLSHAMFSQSHISRFEWALFYSHHLHQLFLEIYSTKVKDKIAFFSLHDQQRDNLLFHIKHLQKKDPILKAFHLQKEGISPGIKMGILLKEGEKLAVNEDIRAPHAIVQRLKKTSLW